MVEERLPTFIDLAALPSMTEATDTNSPDSRLYLREGLVPDREKIYERIVLVDGDEAGLTVKSPEHFENLLGKLAEECQVVYAFSNTDLLQVSHPTLARRGVPGLRVVPV